MYIYWRLEGKKRQLPPIGKSVSVSFRVRVVRACVRACEAVRVREAGVPNAGGSDGEICDSGAGFGGFWLFMFWCYTRGF